MGYLSFHKFSDSPISSGLGAQKGWWIASRRFSSELNSNIGKSVTQRKFHCVFNPLSEMIFRSWAINWRTLSKVLLTIFVCPAPKRIRSPDLAWVFDRSSFICEVVKLSLMAPIVSTSSLSLTLINASPPAPAFWASLKISPPGFILTLLIKLLPFSMVMLLTHPPEEIAFEKT